jgi:hypothetical protein
MSKPTKVLSRCGQLVEIVHFIDGDFNEESIAADSNDVENSGVRRRKAKIYHCMTMPLLCVCL